MQTKYLVSWPSTWEPEENIFCHDLLKEFEAGLPQSIAIGDDNDHDDNNDKEPVWCVEKILEKEYDQNGKVGPMVLLSNER